MTWHVHAADRTIRESQIVGGEPPLLAASTLANRVEFFDLITGVGRGHLQIAAPPTEPLHSPVWDSFLASIAVAPGLRPLPRLSWGRHTLYSTDDGCVRLLYTRDDQLQLLQAGQGHAIIGGGDTAAVDIDRTSGNIAMLDREGQLVIFAGHEPLLRIDTGLRSDPFRTPTLSICARGHRVFLTDGLQIVSLDVRRSEIQRIETHYGLGRMAPSPSGGILLCSDNDAGLIRAYRGSDLVQTHQRFAQDLIAEAQQVQLMADMPPSSVAVSALTMGENGVIAFAMSGAVCVTDLESLTALP